MRYSGTEVEWNIMWKRFLADSSGQEGYSILYALAQSKQLWLIQKYAFVVCLIDCDFVSHVMLLGCGFGRGKKCGCLCAPPWTWILMIIFFCKLRIEEMRSSLEVKRSNSNQYIFLNKNGIPLIKRKPSNNSVLRITPMWQWVSVKRTGIINNYMS